MKVYSLMNQKGGVGKSTIAVCLAHGLSLDGFRVLLVDTDAQRNSTLSCYGSFPDPNEHPYSTFELLYYTPDELTKQGIRVEDIIIHTPHCDLIPASQRLAIIEPMIVSQIGKEFRLQRAFEQIKDLYDFVIIDSPPVLGTISVNDLTASTGVIIPSLADLYSLSALGEIQQQINTVNEFTRKNDPVRTCGIVLNLFDAAQIVSRDLGHMIDETAETFGIRIFETRIRKCSTISKAQAEMSSLWDYTQKHRRSASYVLNGVMDFYAFIKEFLKAEGIRSKGNLTKYMNANFDM